MKIYGKLVIILLFAHSEIKKLSSENFKINLMYFLNLYFLCRFYVYKKKSKGIFNIPILFSNI